MDVLPWAIAAGIVVAVLGYGALRAWWENRK